MSKRVVKRGARKSAVKKKAGTKKAAAKKTAKKAASQAAGERRVDRRLVDSTVEMLAAHDWRTAESKRAIGTHVFERYYGGDEAAVRSKTAYKAMSFALLLERAELETEWDATELRRAVLAAIVYRSLSAEVRDHVPATYLHWLSQIDDLATREAIASRIARGELRGGDDVARAIAELGAPEREGGRPAQPEPLRLVRSIERQLERSEGERAMSAREIRAIDAPTRAALAERLRETARRLEALATRLAD